MKLVKENNLNSLESKSLLTTIYLGFQYKKLTADHIDYKKVRAKINGVEIKPQYADGDFQ